MTTGSDPKVTGTNTSGLYGTTGQVTVGTGQYGNANVAAFLQTYTGNLTAGNASVSGNITGGNILTNNYLYANGQPVSFAGTYSNANVANYLPVYSGNIGAGNIAATGEITAAVVSTTGNITGLYILGNGSQLTGLPQPYGNANVAAYLPTYTGNLAGGNLSVTGNVAVDNDLTVGGTIFGTFSGNITGNLVVPGANTDILFNNAGNAGASSDFTFNDATNTLSLDGNIVLTGASERRMLSGDDLLIAASAQKTLSLANPSIEMANIDMRAANITMASTGNANVSVAGAVSVSGNVTGNYILGNGSQLTGLPATYGNANVANYLPTYSGNVGSVSTPLTINGSNANVNGNIIRMDGNAVTVTAGLTTLDLQAQQTIRLRSPLGTTANVLIESINTSVTGNILQTSGVLSTTGNITGSNLRTGGSVSATGNVTGNYIIGDGSLLTNINAGNIVGSYGNANVANFLPNYGSNTISTSGNITAGNITADGQFLTNLPGANVTGTVANATYALTANNSTFAGTVTTAAQPNITSLGTLTSVSSTGNITGGNLVTAGFVSATGNVTGNYFIGDGSLLTGIASSYGNANVANFLPNYGSNTISTSGNITSGNLATTGSVSATGNITANTSLRTPKWTIEGNVITSPNGGQWYSDEVNLDEYLTSRADGYIDLQALYANSAVGSEVHLEHGLAHISTNPGIDPKYWYFYGNGLMTAAGAISTTGNVTANYFIGDGSQLTNLPAGSYGNANVANYLPTFTGNVGAGNVVLTSNTGVVYVNNITGLAGQPITIQSDGTEDINLNADTIRVGDNGADATIGSHGTGDLVLRTHLGDANQGNIILRDGAGGNIDIQTNGSGVVNITGTAGLRVADGISAVGNVTGNYFIGNGSLLTGIAGSYGNANVSNFLANGFGSNNITTTGTIQAGNLSVTNLVSNPTGANVTLQDNLVINGNVIMSNSSYLDIGSVRLENDNVSPASMDITADSVNFSNGISANAIDTGTISLSGNVLSAINTTNNITTTANVSANNISITNIISNPAGANITLQDNLIVNGNISMANSTVLRIGSASIENDNVAPASINITAESVDFSNGVTAVAISCSGNITGGNLLTPGQISATGNITGNYFLGNGSQLTGITATANAGGSNTQIQFNDAGAFGGNANVTFNKATGNMAVGNIIFNTGTSNSTTGVFQNWFRSTNNFVGNANANATMSGRILLGDGWGSTPGGGGTGDFGPTLDSTTLLRGAAVAHATRYTKTDNGVFNTGLVSTSIVDINGNIGTSNVNSRVQGMSTTLYIGGGNSVSSSAAFVRAASQFAFFGNVTNGPQFSGPTSVTTYGGVTSGVQVASAANVTNSIGYLALHSTVPGGNIANSVWFTGSLSNSSGATQAANLSVLQLQDVTGNGWGVGTVPASNYRFLDNTDTRSKSRVGPIESYFDRPYTFTSTTGNVNLDWTNGTAQYLKPTGNMNLAFTGATTSSNGNLFHTVTLVVEQGTTAYTINLPAANATIKYSAGVGTVPATANAVVMITSTAANINGSTTYLTTVSPEFS